MIDPHKLKLGEEITQTVNVHESISS